MKKILTLTSIIVLCAFASQLHAENRLFNGAGTLDQGEFGVSLGLGAALPSPLIYDVKGFYGITHWLQFGVGGSTFGRVLSSASGELQAQVFKSTDAHHILGVRVQPSYMYTSNGLLDLKGFSIAPTLLYEYRVGDDERPTGFIFHAGSQHMHLTLGSDLFNAFFNKSNANTTMWLHALTFGTGIQHQFGEHFSMSADVTVLSRTNFKSAVPTGALRLNWAF